MWNSVPRCLLLLDCLLTASAPGIPIWVQLNPLNIVDWLLFWMSKRGRIVDVVLSLEKHNLLVGSGRIDADNATEGGSVLKNLSDHASIVIKVLRAKDFGRIVDVPFQPSQFSAIDEVNEKAKKALLTHSVKYPHCFDIFLREQIRRSIAVDGT
jgi:hypothetical protein